MKIYDFEQSGGFPVETEVFSDLQYSGEMLEKVSRMCGRLAVIEGCEQGMTTVSDGIVVINGELLEFKSGIIQPNVIIREETKSDEFENGQIKIVRKYRYASFGTGPVQYAWADFKRVTDLSTVEERLARLEKICKPILQGNSPILFLKPAAEIPEGYVEWTDSAGLTLVGRKQGDADFGVLGTTGGAKEFTIQKQNLPAVQLGINLYAQGAKYVDDNGPMDNIGGAANGAQFKTELLGSGTSIKKLDPYRIVNYIIYNG